MQLSEASARFSRWLTITQDLSPHTIRAYESDVKSLEQTLGHRFNSSELAVEHLHRFLEEMTTAGLSSASIRRRYVGVRMFCRWLHRAGVIDANPSADVSVRFSRSRSLPRAVSTHDLRLLLRSLSEAVDESVSHRWDSKAGSPPALTTLLSVALMVGTGVRVGELVAIRVCDLDLPSRTIRVLGKGRRERVVFLSNDRICESLADYPASTGSREPQCPLLINRYGRALSTATMRSRIDRASVRAGTTSRITPHMLRHTAATQLIEAGVDIRFVQRLLGHASLTTTEIYTHVTDVSLRRAVLEADVLGQALKYG